MVRYRVTHNVESEFECVWPTTNIVESDEALSRKDIAKRLNIDVNKIVDIKIL